MSEKSKYRVNLVKINDVAKLMSLLKDFTWFDKGLPTNYLAIDIIDKSVAKVNFLDYTNNTHDYRPVTYDEMIEILAKKSYGLTPEKAAKISLNTQKAYMEKYPTKNDDNAKKLLDKIQSSTFEELDARATKAHEKETLKQNLDILNDHLLNGTRIQFKHSGEQWHNVTGKFNLEQLKHKSIKLRVRPDRVSIDGYMFTPQQAIDYINRNYDNG